MSTVSTGLRLKKLRALMKNTNYVSQCLQAYIIPSEDAHQCEYIALHHKRRQFISGFTGSTGTAVVTEKFAALWTDGRYLNQAEKELDDNWLLMKAGHPDCPKESKWLCDVLSVNSKVGVDPYLLCFSSWKRISNELKLDGHELVPVTQNLIDIIWDDRPVPEHKVIDVLPLKYTGMSWQEKITFLREEMVKVKVSVLVVTALDEIAWLFNLRGSDIDYCPVFFSYAVLTSSSIHFFVDESRLTPSAVQSLTSEENEMFEVTIHPYEDISQILSNILEAENEGKFWISPLSSYALVSLLPEEKRLLKLTPIALKKALKNETEIAGAINAHIKDAVALCEYFAWLSTVVAEENITEVSAAEKLEHFRSSQEDYKSLSFETISASGSNGAVIHYRPSPETDKKITTEELYLCDSGGQYLDGTTDVTRTLHFGVPTPFEKECYTLVLKGQIALSSAKFPKWVNGNALDSFARKYLWDAGLDYCHSTGHGVGAFLNVHEGPMLIGFRTNPYDPGLQPGMILSIEPGYYEDGRFGIRLENLAYIKEYKTCYKKQKEFLNFESLTLVPYQSKLIEPSLLTADEIKWINEYHGKCREVVGKVLNDSGKMDALQWLLQETMPLG